MKCENCGNILNDDAVFCPLCGGSNLIPINNNNQGYNNQNINNSNQDYYGNNMNNYNSQNIYNNNINDYSNQNSYSNGMNNYNSQNSYDNNINDYNNQNSYDNNMNNYNTQSNYNNMNNYNTQGNYNNINSITSTNQNNYSNTNNLIDKSKKNIVCGISLFVIAVFILIFGIYNSTHQVKRYKVLNEDNFKQIMETDSYKVVDLTKSYANQKYISKYYTASSGNKSIIYILLNEDDKGNNLYSSIKKNITNYASNENDIITDIDNSNIKKYVINNGKKYAVLVKVDNMIIYTITETKYMDEMDNIFKDLGYKTTDFKGNMLYFIISISIILILYLISIWRLFVKLGEKGIYSIIPIYNIYILSKKLLGNGIFFIGFLIPIVNIILAIYLNYKLGKMFNKNIIFIIELIILNPIFLIILSFDNSDYIGMKVLN